MATHHTGFLELMDRIIVLEEGNCVLEGRFNLWLRCKIAYLFCKYAVRVQVLGH